MKNVIGIPARGENFYPRKREVKRLLKALSEGANVQLAAPRRVGKTSILMYLLDNDLDENHYLYLNTEAVEDSNNFFKKIYFEIIKSKYIGGSDRVMEQLKIAGNNFLKKIKGFKVGGTGIELSENEDLDFYEELTNLLKGIELEKGRIMLMIDEFPYTISNILEKSDDEAAAINFLQKNRSLRQDPEINSKIQFIYTGSIGLNTTVANINATSLINDIMSIKVDTLNIDEAQDLVHRILDYEVKTITKENLEYLLKRIEWLTPFYIKLIIKEIIDIMKDEETDITDSLVNDAFQEIIDFRNNNYFEHYYSRLYGFFNDHEFDFIIDTLNYIVNNNSASKNEIFNIATKHSMQKEHRNLLHTLIYDGYIHSNDGGDTYRFNSPILKLWWKKYVSN